MSGKYIIQRILSMIYVLFVVSIIVFFVTRILPGDAAVMRLGQNATEAALEALRARMGLDEPVWIQYGRWLLRAVTGEFGLSFRTGQPVGPMVLEALSRSLQLGGLALFFTLIIAVPLGIMAAVRRGRRIDLFVSTFSYIGSSIPEFVSATLLIMVFAEILGLLPSTGYVPLGEDVPGAFKYLILPAFSVSIILVSHISRMVRSELIDVLNTDYIRAAISRGITPKAVLLRHALPNALLPAITIVALDVGYLLGGIIVIENIFSIPGIGRGLLVAINNRDIPSIQAGVLIIAATYSFANFAADMIYTWLDPRIGYD